ncbi:hypothetical protein MCOR02_011708 [Pyricularia oryzae]|nr:hypothetical protein MCOR02_011708 [Pyricularia oryzae]KAI6308817.1 hypothetical protein MCOR34_007070 [Pyricularia oryzae]KAI6454278.1 hypothetical protein MCOR17_009034 [Pyricularia oryzae]KAI6491345.1 hypothetical protein MCOR13_008307 [Pyricularia oryzae]KAI6587650.1 hypothetical protein MCOR04_004283 [Pyricularia oryzae]
MPSLTLITHRLIDSSHDFSFSSIWAVVWGFLVHAWTIIRDFVFQPHVWPIILTCIITFTVIMLVFSVVGFGPRGVIAGTLAAAFQSWMYGGFTPAGGLFAVFTSMGMLGILMPAAALLAALVACGLAAVVWAFGVGY